MLFKQIKTDRLVSFKKRNIGFAEKVSYELLGTLIAESSKKDKEPSDKIVIDTIKKFIDNATFVIKAKPNSKESFRSEKEIEILSHYLPKQLTEEEIRFIFLTIKNENSNNINIGMFMKTIKEFHEGCYDGKLASEIAKEFI